MLLNTPLLATLLLGSPLLVNALDAAGWRQQSIYQLLTDRFAREDDLDAPCNLPAREYCGGTWKGLIDKLDYIQGMGFTAVWISPISSQLPTGYHGYYTTNFYKPNERFGTADDLKRLSAELHRRGMYLMLDVIANHVATPRWDDFRPEEGGYEPFNRREDYHTHHWCRNWDDQEEMELCWLGEGGDSAMPDINTESPRVVEELHKLVRWMVNEYNADGLRIDTVKHVRKDFWPGYEAAAGVFCTGEVLHGDPSFTLPYQGEALESVLNYPIYFPLRRAFESPRSEMIQLTDMILRVQYEAKDPTVLTTFLDNHDLARFAHQVSDEALQRNALAYPLLGDGIPITYSGAEHGYAGGEDPWNREPLWHSGFDTTSPLYGFLARVNAARMTALRYSREYATLLTTPLVTTEHELVLHRAPLISVLTNRGGEQGNDAVLAFTVPGLKTGDMLVDIAMEGSLDLADRYLAVGTGGSVRATIKGGKPRVFLPKELLGKYTEIRGRQERNRGRVKSARRNPKSPPPSPRRPMHHKRQSSLSSLANSIGAWIHGKQAHLPWVALWISERQEKLLGRRKDN